MTEDERLFHEGRDAYDAYDEAKRDEKDDEREEFVPEWVRRARENKLPARVEHS